MTVSRLREAIQHCQRLNMGFNMYGSLQYRIYYREDDDLVDSCLVDYDIEQVIEKASSMRRERNELQSGDKQW